MYLGIDFGTSGCRACVIDNKQTIIAECKQTLAEPIRDNGTITQNPQLWWQGLSSLLNTLNTQIDCKLITNICINGTSGTVLACDKQGKPLSDALMYNDTSSHQYVDQIKTSAPSNHVTLSASSGLAKILLLQNSVPESAYFLNQADWISNKLTGQFAYSDYNNALKMGYDCIHGVWPAWIEKLVNLKHFPKVLTPGTSVGYMAKEWSKKFGFNDSTTVKVGTTDSIAAFIATGANTTSQSVTSLGSTLVLKTISNKPIENSDYGIYSHKLGKLWLVGGASNSGGKVIREYFDDDELISLSSKLNPEVNTQLKYYPLPAKGERFPVNNPDLAPKLSPKAKNKVEFLQALFEGIAAIEKMGYDKLTQLGASYPSVIFTCGGGAKNIQWQQIRTHYLNTNIQTALNSEACYGSAILAKNGLQAYQ